MTREVRPEDVKTWLSDGDEIAFFDVREAGQFGEGHPFFAIPLPYSVFESRLGDLAPNRGVRMVLMDGGDGVAGLAAKRAVACGYADVMVMKGGAPAWAKAGYTLYEGVNLPSKTFGEILEIKRHTPRKSAEEVAAMSRDGTDHVIVDGRPYAEYEKFNIPGGICCPNGELALRIGEIAPDPKTTIVVNCAGRTRSILGAQTLIDFGVPNPVYALENGTQGWFLAGMQPEKGADRRYPEAPVDAAKRAALREKSRRRAEATGVKFISADDVQAWWDDTKRTTCGMRPAASSSRRPTSGSESRARGSCLSMMTSSGRPWSRTGFISSAMTWPCWKAGSMRSRASGSCRHRCGCRRSRS
jgi:rhodanese-related sulfurtransferase